MRNDTTPAGHLDTVAGESSPADRHRRERQERIAAAALFTASGVQAGTWSARLPAVQHRLGIGSAELGMALVGSGLGILVGIGLASRMSWRTADPRWAAGCCAAYGGTLALLGMAPSLWTLFLALVLVGLAGGVVTVMESLIGAAVERSHGRPAMSLLFGMLSIGALAGSAAGVLAAAVGMPPVAHFLLVAALLAVTSLTAGGWLPRGRSDPGPRDQRRAESEPRPRIWLLALLAFVAVLVQGTTMDWSAIYVRGYLGAPEALAAVAPTVFVGFVCIGRFGGNAAVSRYGWTATLGACGALAGVGVVVVGTAPDTALALLGLGLLGAGLSCLVPLATAAAAVAAGDRSAEAVGLVSMVACVPYLVGPPLVGFTAVGAGLRMVFLGLLLPLAIVVAVACLASGGVAIARDTLTSRRPEADSETLVSRDGPGWTRARPSGG